MAIKTIKTPGGEEFNIDEWLHWPLYSTIESGALLALDLRAFGYVVGGNVPGSNTLTGTSGGSRNANEADTNQVAKSRMNQDEQFLAFSMTYEHFAVEGTTNSNMAFTVAPNDLAAEAPQLWGTNLRRLQMSVLLDLMVGANISKPQARAPLSYYGQGIGAVASGSGDAVAISVGAATALNLDYGTAGCVSPTNQRRWNLPVNIKSDTVMADYNQGTKIGVDSTPTFLVNGARVPSNTAEAISAAIDQAIRQQNEVPL